MEGEGGGMGWWGLGAGVEVCYVSGGVSMGMAAILSTNDGRSKPGCIYMLTSIATASRRSDVYQQ